VKNITQITIRFLIAIVFAGVAGCVQHATAREVILQEPAMSEVKAEAKTSKGDAKQAERKSARDEALESFNRSRFELFGGFKYTRPSAQPVNNLSGVEGNVSLRVRKWLSLRAEIGAGSGRKDKIDFHRQTLRFGPQFTLYSNHNMRAFAVALVGLVHDSSRFNFVPARHSSASACVWTLGGGLDLRLSDHISFRVFQIMPNLFRGEWQNDGAITSGLIFHFGGKSLHH
jgi:opacity protein-like surface antigen